MQQKLVMGKCLSCCQPSPRPPQAADHTQIPGRDDRRQRPLYNVLPPKEVTSNIDPIPQPQPLLLTHRPTSQPQEKKMFAPKLHPVAKKGSIGDNKRISLVSRDYSESKIQQLYEQYKEPNEDLILAEGIETFCYDLELKPDDFIVLLLAWKFHAQTMCRFTKEEFMNGCKMLKVDSIKGIQSKFSELLAEVQNKQSFKDLYRWTYKFGLDSEIGQRTLPLDMALSLWKLVFSQNTPNIVILWLDFLEKNQTIRGIPKDTWELFLNFVDLVGDDLTTYDDTEAWPSLFDDFVECENDRQNQNVKMDEM